MTLLQDLMEAGAHFGHQTSKWNPKMKPFIFGRRNGIHIINLDRTIFAFRKATDLVREMAAQGRQVLFVATKRQAQETVMEEATRAQQPYVNQRWLGGTLTNFETIRSRISRLEELTKMNETNDYGERPKKEILKLEKLRQKLIKNLGGIQTLKGSPGAVVLVDPNCEHIAVHEANRARVPVIALVDTNCNPDQVDCVIPSNDDSVRSIRIFLSRLADAVLEGVKLREERLRSSVSEAEARAGEGVQDRSVEVAAPRSHQKIYIAREREQQAPVAKTPTIEIPDAVRKKIEETPTE